MENMFSTRSMRPQWCYFLEEANTPIGQAALWTLPKLDIPLSMVLWELPWESENLIELGAAFFADLFPLLKQQGAKQLEYVLDTPPHAPQFQTFPEKRAQLLRQAGFTLERETMRFEWNSASSTLPPHSPPLQYRSLSQVGEEDMIEAIMRVSMHTLDKRIENEREQLGAYAHAKELYADLQNMQAHPDWWQIGYTHEGELVGIVLPAFAPAFATIAYIGVVPEHRGKRYIDSLLAQGTKTLLNADVDAIRADTDIRNVPMQHAFLRAGYQRFAQRSEYLLKTIP
ncbi:GNAT family N-acetyltransferase [Brevibacillus migulae]|uniref:GNAT family N-acetyltransferase n=1 Tax=Brevibacillus migulae TaxID=1644114 RepID=UPI001F3D2E05|nr:GNAT family N-acetyltransferase [Brevibacillus migulae]